MMWYDVNEEEKFIKKYFKMAKKLVEDTKGSEASEKEVREVLHLVKFLSELSLEQTLQQMDWEERLDKEPKGFLVDTDSGPHCVICNGGRGTGETRWFDKHGMKCMNCQKAIDDHLIPASVASQPESYYSDKDLDAYFNLHGKVLTQWINKGLILCRKIRKEKTAVHFRVFLLADNEKFLPPKQLLDEAAGDSGSPWYHCVNPLKYLKDYGIINYLRPVKEDQDGLQDQAGEEESKPAEPEVSYCHTCSFPDLNTPVVKKRKAKRLNKPAKP